MTVANIAQRGLPDYPTQTGSGYPLAIDAAMKVMAEIARSFAPHASEAGSPSAPDMTVTIDAGRIWNPVTRAVTAVAAQTTGTITAPAADPRRDIVYIDRLTGVIGVETGAEAASPADPTIPVGKLPVARINLTVGMTVIDDMDIDDIRMLAMLGVPFGHGDELSRIFPGSSSPDEFVQGTLDEIPVWQKVNGLWRSVQPRHLLDGLERLDTGSPSIALDDVNDLIPVWHRGRRELMMIAAGEIGGAGGLVPIDQAVASASASISIAGLDSTYDEYIIQFINLLPATDGAGFPYIRLSTDNGATFKSAAGSYRYIGIHQSASAAATLTGFGSGSVEQISLAFSSGQQDSGANSGLSGTLHIYKNSSAQCKLTWAITYVMDSATAFVGTRGQAQYILDADAVNAIQFLYSSGNVASGTMRAYGVKNS